MWEIYWCFPVLNYLFHNLPLTVPASTVEAEAEVDADQTEDVGPGLAADGVVEVAGAGPDVVVKDEGGTVLFKIPKSEIVTILDWMV